MRLSVPVVWLALGASVALLSACGSSPAKEPETAAQGTLPEVPEPEPSTEERELDRRLAPDNIEKQLAPFIASVGAGFGAGYQPTGFVAISGAGEVLYVQGFGFRDHGAREPNTAETSFRIGAVSEPFTAAAVLRLSMQGKLSLDDPISRHLPEYPQPGASITLHQLLSHTSGLPNYLSDPALLERRSEPLSPRQLLERFWSAPLEFSPGSDFRYSDSNYVVLGAIIERAAGRSYAEHVRRDIFQRFGLKHTAVGDDAAGTELARGYSASSTGALEPARLIDASLLYSAAGVRSTARDLLRWHDALQTRSVLDAPHMDLMVRPVLGQFGYGWFVREEHGFTVLSHTGATPGYVTHFARVPELDLAIAVLINNSAVDALPIADAALRAALGQEVKPREKASALELDTALTSRITGTFRLNDAAAEELKRRKIPRQALQSMRSIRVYEEGGKLYFKPTGQAAVQMLPSGPSAFVLLGGKAKIEVPLDPDGAPATRLLLEQGPLKVEYTRRARVRGKPEEPEESDDRTER